MPWKTATVIEKRKEFVMLAQGAETNISDLCRRFGVSRKTGYKWLNRFDPKVEGTLEDRSRAPHYSPGKTEESLEEAILKVREKHPAWGGRKIAHVLKRDRGQQVAPSTVTAVLHRHGKITAEASEAAMRWKRFERPEPNQLWQMDFKGHFAVGAERCHPLTALDDHSRFNLTLTACTNEREKTVQDCLKTMFQCYGLPLQINVDNGPPWGTGGQGPLTELTVWLMRLGIVVTHSRPWHPQTNGKEERFHRSLKAEVLAWRFFEKISQVQEAFDQWRWVYNSERPHESLSMQAPIDRYKPSKRVFPDTLPAIEYGPDDRVRKVQGTGSISFKGYELRISKALVGQPVALRPQLNTDGKYDVYFCRQRLDTVDLNQMEKH